MLAGNCAAGARRSPAERSGWNCAPAHVAALHHRGEGLAMLAWTARSPASPARRSRARSRRWSPAADALPAANRAHAAASVFQPMCGTRTPAPACSLAHAARQQAEAFDIAFLGTLRTAVACPGRRPAAASSSAAQRLDQVQLAQPPPSPCAAAPTPGRTTRSALARPSGIARRCAASTPSRCSANRTEPRFAPPASTSATSVAHASSQRALGAGQLAAFAPDRLAQRARERP